jgi:transposase
VATREDIEQIDVEAVADSPAGRSLLLMMKTMLLQLMGLMDQLQAEHAERKAELDARRAEVEELKKALFGQRSERQKRSERAPRAPVDPAEAARRQREGQRKRKANREKKAAEAPVETVEHPAPSVCPGCHADGPFSQLPPEVSYIWERVPERLVKHRHTREKYVCGCGHIAVGDAPERVGDSARYGPGLHADAVVTKCADAMPINRLAKRYQRQGIPMSRSSLNDLFHRSAGLLEPIWKRLQQLVASASHVNADETSQPVMDEERCRRGYMWTFLADDVVVYVFSATRSGSTAVDVLGDSVGVLQVDGYTGYNEVTTPEKRKRAGCLAHARRYFTKARNTCPDEADYVFDLIRKVYRVEYGAAARDLTGTPGHLVLRKLRSAPLMEEFHDWLLEQEPLHLPKSPGGAAIKYCLNQWEYLCRFLEDPKVRLDNNISESALRIVALGRDNFRWVGSDKAGENLATLQTVVHTCIACGVNPNEYLADVLVRVGTHPAAAIDDLLPMNWTAPT